MRQFVRWVIFAAIAGCVAITGTLIAQDISGSSSSGAAQTAVTSTVSSTSSESAAVQSLAAGGEAVPVSHPPFVRVLTTPTPLEYGVTGSSEVYVSQDSGKSWALRDKGLPLRVVYPFTGKEIEQITAIGADPLDPAHVAVTTSLGLWVSSDAGLQWSEIPLEKPIKSVAYVTSVAVSPWSPDSYALATSFSSVFETTDNGKHWTDLSDSLRFLYKGAGFYEEVSGLAYSPTERGVLYLAADFGGGVYRSTPDKSSWVSIHFPAGNDTASYEPGNSSLQVIEQLAWRKDSLGWSLEADTTTDKWAYSLTQGSWRGVGTMPPLPPPDPAKAARLAKAADRSGIYLADVNASGPELDKKIAFIKANGLNSVVVDVKDDYGRLTYDSHIPLARQVGAVHPLFDLKELIRKAHANGIYVIGRMVIFKDEELYGYDNHKYAVWDQATGQPWAYKVKETDPKTGQPVYVQKEYWVDPYSETVWKYNVDIAKELQSMGIDELQFDYIRFPSDGDLAAATYRFKRPGMNRIDALESFMRMARAAIHIPISTDLYGFNCWYRMGNWIGQNVDMLAKYVDVICPMYYPSLFPREFLADIPYLDRAKLIYQEGTERTRAIARGRADIRPFVQAFLLGGERKMDTPEYSRYLKLQLEGAQAARSSGFTLWNASNIYYMVTFPLGHYVTPRPTADLTTAAPEAPAAQSSYLQ